MDREEIRVLIDEIKALKNQELRKLVLDDNDLIEILKVSRRTLATYRANGQISFSKVNGRVYYTWDDVSEFLENHRIKAYRHERA